MRDELVSELLSTAPGAYKGDPVRDSGSFADGTANTIEEPGERELLEMSNDVYWSRHPYLHSPSRAVPGGAVDLVDQLPAHLLGRRQGDPPPQLPRLPVPGGGTMELAREVSRPMSVAERRELAREVPDIWGDVSVGMHPWLEGGSGDPVADNLGPEGW